MARTSVDATDAEKCPRRRRLDVRRKEALEVAGSRVEGRWRWCPAVRIGRTAQGAKPRKLRPGRDTWITGEQL